VTFRTIHLLGPEDRRRTLEADLRAGLETRPLRLSPIWLYDERGSELFDEITRLPEYYPTRSEQEIFDAHAAEIVEMAQCDTLVELGSGTSEKTRTLLDALAAAGTLRHFVALDVSEEILVASAEAIHRAYDVDVTAVVGDFTAHLDAIPAGGRRLFAFLGGTIGNFEPAARADFLGSLCESMTPEDVLLLGTDLQKDRARLVAAYDDAAGVTAEFEKNALAVVNTAFGADFDLDRFQYVARFDEEHGWIEMALVAIGAQRVAIPGLDLTLDLDDGEEIRTEVSTKFLPPTLDAELVAAGFSTEGIFTDRAGDFRVTLARPKG
jgi:L-histidine Nalpha-methyltransferase